MDVDKKFEHDHFGYWGGDFWATEILGCIVASAFGVSIERHNVKIRGFRRLAQATSPVKEIAE